MGLGKSIEMISLLLYSHQQQLNDPHRCTLLIVPLTLLGQVWMISMLRRASGKKN